jgi:molybdopterin converting factor small subunit
VVIRVRLGHGVARLASSPVLSVELDQGATVADACTRLGTAHPDLARALPSTLAIVGGAQVGRHHALSAGDELALLMPLSGGAHGDS